MTAFKPSPHTGPTSRLYAWAYRTFSYLGLMTVFGSLLHGFRHDSNAPAINYGLNLLLYAAFMIPHLVMTRPWFKQRVWGSVVAKFDTPCIGQHWSAGYARF